MPKLTLTDWSQDDGTGHVTGEALGPSEYKLIGRPGGLTQFGAHIERLPPGSKSSPEHAHAGEDEMVLMLEGTVTLIENGTPMPLHAGEAACWPAGCGITHCLENRGETPAVYLVVGTRAQRDIVDFADHDLRLHNTRDADGTLTRRKTRRDGSAV